MWHYFVSKEALVTIGLLFVSVVFFVSALELPAGTFDPLGPGAAPEMVAFLLGVLCTVVLIRGGYDARVGTSFKQKKAIDVIEHQGEKTPSKLVVFFATIVAYIVAFEMQLGHFVTLTIPFIMISMMGLGGLSLRLGLISLVIAVVLSCGLFYVLTEFFVVRLPGI